MLGIEENNKPVDIEYLAIIMKDCLDKYPNREEYYKTIMPEVYNEMIKTFKYDINIQSKKK